MKTRVTITIDSVVVQRAKELANARHMSLSTWIEELLKQNLPYEVPTHKRFTGKWTGKFSLREVDERDVRS